MIDSRTAAHVLSRIAAYLELKGENSFKCRAYLGAAKALRSLDADDLAPLYASGELAAVRGLGPATLAVIRDLVETGESRYLEQLRASTPEGLLDMLGVAGMTPARIHQVYEELHITTVEQLEAAARDGTLSKLKKIGPKTAAKVLDGIAAAREHGALRLYHHVLIEARQLLASIGNHPDVQRAELSGDLRRHAEVVGRIDIVAACARDPRTVAQSFARVPGVRASEGDGATVDVHFIDGAQLRLTCVEPDRFGVAMWWTTGTEAHVAAVTERLRTRGLSADAAELCDSRGSRVTAREERDVYAAAGLDFVPPELREGTGEVEAAADHTLPALVSDSDIRGVLHCHSSDSDGTQSIADMARGAQARGWSYIGITDHSQAAFYAGGLSPERVLEQHAEIDALNATLRGIRILKGIEADILADGRLDYDDALLDRFDFVVGSIHSRFSMDRETMTARVLRALEDPRLTILAHPTGRLLLGRPPYALDVDALLAKAAETGVAIELNADPHRLDLDWRYLHRAKMLGIPIEIGPDAHSVTGLDNVAIGVGVARKGWLEASDVLKTRDVDGVLAFARHRRTH